MAMAVDGAAGGGAIQRPDAKSERYDRGMRLWGREGQKALEDCHLCLLKCTGTAAETVKNLVLPGIGKVTVVDGEKVSWADLGCNFFVDEESIGRSRAEVVASLLQEMNPQNVRCCAIPVSPAELMEDRPDFFEKEAVHCVVAADLPEQLLRVVAEKCEAAGCSLVSVRVNGMVGLLRLWGGEHRVIEGFPDNELEDMRVLNPFPQLQQFFDQCGDPAKVTDTMEHAHIPWPVLAAWYTKVWREQTGASGMPTEWRQRKQIKELILQGRLMRTLEEMPEEERKAGAPPGPRDEQNYEEAANNLNKLLPPKVPAKVEKILADPRASALAHDTPIFWVLVHSLNAFYKEHGVMPISGNIPDMTATSKSYVALKQVYRDEAQRNCRWIKEHATKSLRSIGRDSSELPDALVSKFCKNALYLRIVDFKSVTRELAQGNADLAREVGSAPSDAWWYVMWRASERFFALKGRHPGDTGTDVDAETAADVEELERIVRAVLAENQCSAAIPREHAKEWCRFGHSELHSIASIIGGVAAQEVIKLVTRQRVPLDNTFIFNGITNTAAVIRV
eukprot:TRINITY_DN70021_c0_g1_i1.p1 TRINITY_DN70021_c0_g1~~TRINITY_DN70021_c0_g1_i1.p1  ORF type:complete len:563 (+),score=203.54 TRINITY_DN70021_c0_g1_i1:73-1761(+)